MIRNVIFDIGNVLIGFDWKAYTERLLGAEKAARVTAAMIGSGYWPELDRAVLSEDEILELFYSAGPDVRDEIRETYDRVGECVERLEWVIPLIDELRERGYSVYYLSNLSEHVMGSNPDAFDFVGHMDGGVFSCYVNVIKPDLDIYRILLDRYWLDPSECVFIDDHEENIDAARMLGIEGIIYKDREQMIEELTRSLRHQDIEEKADDML